MSDTDPGERSFASRLTHLIQTVHPPDRGPYSYREIAAGVRHHGGAMTAAYVNQLARGKQPYPRIHHVEALAWFFGVPVAYFFDDEVAGRVETRITEAVSWRDAEARHIAERVCELGPSGRYTVSSLVDNLLASQSRSQSPSRPGGRSRRARAPEREV